MTLPVFPDIEAAFHELLSGFGENGVATPPDLENKLPFIRVQAIGGGDDRVTDSVSLAVSVFTADRSGLEIAEQIRQTLTATGGKATSVGVIDRITTDLRPIEVPWTDGATIRQFAARYRVRARRRFL